MMGMGYGYGMTGIGMLFLLVHVAVVVYFFVLLGRIAGSLKRIADTMADNVSAKRTTDE